MVAVEPDVTPARNKRLPSLRLLVTSIVVVPIATVAIALLVIAAITSSNISEQLGEELVGDATERVSSDVRNYIGQAARLSNLYARRLETGKLSATDLKSWEQIMFDDLVTNPNVAAICFGNLTGDATYLQRAHGRLEVGIADGAKDCAAIEWPAHEDGRVEHDTPIREYRYDPRTRPWYTAVAHRSTPTWTPVYFWFGDAGGEMETGTGYTRPIIVDGNRIGVLTIDVTLGAVSDFLRRQPFASRGAIFIVDDLGMLVAASEGPVTSPQGQRLLLSASDSPSARAVALATPQATTAAAAPGAPAPPRLIGRTIDVAGMGPSRASITPFNPYAGARWRVITVLPESAFLAHAQAMQRRSILFAIGAIIGAVAIGLVFSRRLSRPLSTLIDHVAKIGGGDFRARLELQGARELAHLANETNRMAAGLRERLELEKSIELATHVQQSLLPEATPRIRGMEISSHTRYCDSTGGDYLDFIDVANLGDDRAFIAVGDVSGHGLGTALLMASARAAVRTSAALGNETVGQLMGRVNDVLARDARHGLFMTLLLLILEPVEGKAHWASAGHDPAILFDPRTDSFQEFEGGDIILGVVESVTYGNFSFSGLHPGGVLFIGTDGLWEAHKPDGEMYGKDRVRKILRANASRSANEIAAAMEQSLNEFLESRHPHDDVTFVVVKFVPVESSTRTAATVAIQS